jgi:hypothetical protein
MPPRPWLQPGATGVYEFRLAVEWLPPLLVLYYTGHSWMGTEERETQVKDPDHPFCPNVVKYKRREDKFHQAEFVALGDHSCTKEEGLTLELARTGRRV